MCFFDHILKYLGSVGLFLDLVGAGLLAADLYMKYDGAKYKEQLFDDIGKTLEPCAEYIKHEKKKHSLMSIGAGLLFIGFLFQFFASLVR